MARINMIKAACSHRTSAHSPLDNVTTPYNPIRLLKGAPPGQVSRKIRARLFLGKYTLLEIRLVSQIHIQNFTNSPTSNIHEIRGVVGKWFDSGHLRWSFSVGALTVCKQPDQTVHTFCTTSSAFTQHIQFQIQSICVAILTLTYKS